MKALGADKAEFVICDHTIDITDIPTREGWLYLAAVLDLYSRKVVGWAMEPHMEQELVAAALQMATTRRRPDPGVVHHTDRGSQYAAQDYQQLLSAHHMEVSMSRKGNCYDNAVMESFFATLKAECARGVPVTRPRPAEHLRIYRGVVQSPAPALRARLCQPRNIRTATCRIESRVH